METKPSAFKSALIPGLTLGAISIVYFLLMYIFGIKPVGIMKPIIIMIIGLAINIGFLIFSIRKFRKNLGGFMTFGEGYLYGLIFWTLGSILSTIFTVLFIQFIEPNYMIDIMNSQKEWMEGFMEGKVPQEEIDKALEQIDAAAKNQSSLLQTGKSLLWSIIGGAIISLIIAAIFKKNQNQLETDTLD